MLKTDEIKSSDICVVANPKSGRNSKDAQAIDHAMEALGPGAQLRRWSRDGGLQDEVKSAIADGFKVIVAAGGDGTVMGVAQAMVGAQAHMGVLPLGTFNYFARGLGLPQEPGPAAAAILKGRPHKISVGTVNGTVFLNNASLGLYPAALRAREDVYNRWGRWRFLAHLSLIRTIYRFQRPHAMHITTSGGVERRLRSPLVFVARSAYQLGYFGLEGSDAIANDEFAVFVARHGSRWQMLKLALRLAMGTMKAGRDIELLSTRELVIETRQPRPYVAYDGEKQRMPSPLTFKIHDDALSIIVPNPEDRVSA
ncbi:hypothetical protein JI664_20380 [Rhodobacter sp. NTK016B]|uniref:diacylglycerol/lipid kinase family protein n=1 Tax=Rhodobacter sp. NTK016B TaxID=2759676 RepID=UPI001A8EF1F0|nr:diacylglycerol kinase family protein [Rhodobacter sp. NTK016B]MBN8294342.1 hypothetical protein [Rhodobacter sp. NTK016B]